MRTLPPQSGVLFYKLARSLAMRRMDRFRDNDEFINKALDDAESIFLAMKDGEYPYCIPLNFARIERHLYLHCAFEGHKLDLIARDPHVAFACALDVTIDRAKSTTYFRSVSGRGLACIVENVEEKCLALEAIGAKYDAACPRPCPPETAARVSIIRIDIEAAWGKESVPGQHIPL